MLWPTGEVASQMLDWQAADSRQQHTMCAKMVIAYVIIENLFLYWLDLGQFHRALPPHLLIRRTLMSRLSATTPIISSTFGVAVRS